MDIEALKAAFHADDADRVRTLLESQPQLKALIDQPVGPFDSPAIVNVRSRAMLDALLDAGADIEAPGAVIAGGPPLADARAFGNWEAAHRLVERGATTTLTDAASLGLFDRVERAFTTAPSPAPEDTSRAFWGACHGGQQRCAEFLLGQGAELNWVPSWEHLTPLDAAERSDAGDLVDWLRDRGAQRASDLNR